MRSGVISRRFDGKARRAREVWAPLAFAALLSACTSSAVSVATDACGREHAATGALVSLGDVPRPELREVVMDPGFGTCIERVSDHLAHHHANVVHTGARRQAWNATLGLIAMRSRQVMRSTDSAVVAELPEADTAWIWSPLEAERAYALEGNRLVGFDVATSTKATIIELPRYRSFVAAAGLTELPADGSAAAMIGVRSDGVCELVVVPFGREPATLPCPTDAIGRSIPPLAISLSPSGSYAIVEWLEGGEGRFRGVELYDRALGFLRQLTPRALASDVLLDPAGDEWLVYAAPQPRGPTIVYRQSLRRIEEPRALLEIAWSQQIVISCQARGTEWCVVSTQSVDDSALLPLEGEVFRLAIASEVGAPMVDRLAHHRSRPDYISSLPASDCPISPDQVYPEATERRDGGEVLFASSWGEHCFGELYQIKP